MSDIARALRKNLSVVSRVNGGLRRSREIEQAIARQLDLPVEETFPEWYTADPRPGSP